VRVEMFRYKAGSAILILAASVLCVVSVGYWRPVACKARLHYGLMERKWEAWHRGELSDEDILHALEGYAGLRAPFWEKSTLQEGNTYGGYFSVNSGAITHLGEMVTTESFRVLCRYATCEDRQMNSYAVHALRRRGDPKAVLALTRLLQIEDERWRGKKPQVMRNPQMLTCNVLDAIASMAGPAALPHLREFVATPRVFEREVRQMIARLEKELERPAQPAGRADAEDGTAHS
jgi:hypothetical protein